MPIELLLCLKYGLWASTEDEYGEQGVLSEQPAGTRQRSVLTQIAEFVRCSEHLQREIPGFCTRGGEA